MGWVGEPTHGVRYWRESVERWCRLREKLDVDSFVEIRYEDLVRSPTETLDRCCRLLGESFHPDMLEFHRTSSYEPVDPKLAEQWRRTLDARSAEIIDATCGGLMERFGYQASVPSPRMPRRFEGVALSVRNRLGRARFRFARYGIKRTFTWWFVRGLPLDHPWRLRLRLAMNDIDQRHLK